MAAFDKRWEGGTSTAYDNYLNWALISVRNSSYAWTVSGGGTGEYYLRTAGGSNPGFGAAPGGVYTNGTLTTSGTPGSLAADRWGYGDNDTLGYSTIYIRLSGGGDPDAQALDHVQFRQVPLATDHVRIPAGTPDIESGLKQGAVALGDFIVEEGYEGDIGSDTAPLQIDPDRFEFGATGGTAYIDITTAAIAARILNTGSPIAGERGLYLLGSAISVLDVMRGSVGVATRHGETAAVTTARIQDGQASLWMGQGATLTTLNMLAGDCRLSTAATTVLIYDGTLETNESGAITTVTQKGGDVTANSTGTITTYNLYGGTLNLQKSGSARTISTLNKYRPANSSWQIYRNKEAVTITSEAVQDTYIETAGV